MNKLFGILAIVALPLLMTNTAQAGIFDGYKGPSLSWCKLETSGKSLSLFVVGGSDQEGTITCQKTNGDMYTRNVGVAMGGIKIGLGVCNMEMDLTFAGAEMNINLTPKLMEDILGALVVGTVIKPWEPRAAGAVSVGVNFAELGFKAGLGGVQYGKGCANLASLEIGVVMDENEWEDYVTERRARQQNSGNNN